jgi:hypothetical protein
MSAPAWLWARGALGGTQAKALHLNTAEEAVLKGKRINERMEKIKIEAGEAPTQQQYG